MNIGFLKILFVAILFLLVDVCRAQDTLTIEDAIKNALENNFQILIEKNDVQIASNNNNLVNSGFLPQINASGISDNAINNSQQTFFDRPERRAIAAKTKAVNGEVLLDWTILPGYTLFIAKENFDKLQDIQELESRMAIENTISAVIITYYDIVAQNMRRKVILDAVKLSRERLNLVNFKMDLGSASLVDIYQTSVDLNADTSLLIRQDALIRDLKGDLNTLMARPPVTIFEVSDSVPLNDQLKFEDVAQKATEENSQLYIARRQVELSELNVKYWKSQYLPTLSVYAGYNYLKSQSEIGLLQSNRLHGPHYGVRGNINIFNGFSNTRNIRNATIIQRTSQLRLEQSKLEIQNDLFRIYNNYQSALALVKLEQSNLDMARKNLELSFEKFRLGAIDNIEFRITQQKLVDAENRFVSAIYTAKVAETELMRLSGEIFANSQK